MARKEKDHNPLHGFWVITRTQQKCTDNKWATLRRYHFWDYIWLFHQNPMTDYRPDGCIYNGGIKEMCAGRKTYSVEYSYFTPASRLYLDYPDYSDGGFMWTCHSSSYFVATPDKNTLILYDLEDVGMAPDDYCFRIILKKGCLRNRLIENLKALFLPMQEEAGASDSDKIQQLFSTHPDITARAQRMEQKAVADGFEKPVNK